MVPVLAIGLYWVGTRSWFIIAACRPALEDRLGGEVGVASARYDGDGVFVFHDLVVRARGMRGLAAEVLRAAEVVVDVDVDKLLHGEVEILSARVDGLLIRSSENAKRPGEYNFMFLQHDWDRDEHTSTHVPRVEITSAIIETGIHDGAEYAVVGRRRVAGQMHRSKEDDSIFSFELGEIDERGNGLGENGVVIHGQWNVETFEYVGRVDGLKFDEQSRRMCPQTARFYWDRMQLSGVVGSASIEYRKGKPIVAELTAKNVGVTMPVHVEGLWSIYRAPEVLDTEGRPRVQADECSIRLDGDRLELKLAGLLVGSEPDHVTAGVPYRLNLVVPELPALSWSDRSQWFDHMLATLPFDMQLTMDNFRFDPKESNGETWLELPTAVAKMFALFEMTGWQLSTQIDVSRGPATVNADGSLDAAKIESHGRAFIRHAAGRYRRFPYQLTDVEAYIEFSNDRCDVHYLNGRGAGDSTVRLAGTITPPTRQGAVNLRIDATNVPLDDRLRVALSGQGAEVFDSLFHEPSLQKLAAAPAANVGEGDAAANDAPPAAEPFKLGGVVDLDLDVTREVGPGKRAIITGAVDVRKIGILYEKFPYPITITAGTLDWREDAVTIKSDGETRGLTLETAGGGRGVLSGKIALVRNADGGVEARPELKLALVGDHINPALLAAIPSDDAGDDRSESQPTSAAHGEAGNAGSPLMSRGLATRLLKGIGLSGGLECTGDIVSKPGGALHYDFVVGIKDGAALPEPNISEIMAELGLRWPEGFSLDHVEGVVHIEPGKLGLVTLTGRRGEGTVTASGELDFAGDKPGSAELNVAFKSLALEQYLVDLAPAEGVERAQELWQRYRPQGAFDAELHYRAEPGQPGAAELVVQPNVLRITAAGQPVSMFRKGGEVVLHDNEVRLEQLELEVFTRSREDGTLVLDGSYGASAEGDALSVAGAWRQGMFECPLIPEMMQLVGATNESARYQTLVPAGQFDAKFSYRSPRGDAPLDYKFEIKPSAVAMVLDGMVLSTTLEPSSTITITPGLITFDDVEGEHTGGTFRAEGHMSLGEAPTIDLSLGYRGDLVSQQVWIMLPEEVRSALEDIHFQSNQAGLVRDAKLHMAKAAASDDWSMDFTGVIETGSCAFDVGIPFSEVDGRFEVTAQRPAGGPADVTVTAEANRVRVLEREMTNLSARLHYSQAEEALSISELRGELYGGVISAEAKLGLGGDRRDYAMNIVSAGVHLDEIARAESLSASEEEVRQLAATRDRRHMKAEEPRQPAASGQLFASLDLAGERGRPYTRTGRGTLKVVGGEVANLSLTLRVLQLMQFIPPFADRMDYADVDYYVAGDRVVFERILLEIPFMDRAALQLHGEGEMDFNTFELDTRFRSRGTIPMLSDIVGGLSDRLYQIEVTGPISDPVARVLALPDFSSRRGASNSVRLPAPAQYVQEPVN